MRLCVALLIVTCMSWIAMPLEAQLNSHTIGKFKEAPKIDYHKTTRGAPDSDT